MAGKEREGWVVTIVDGGRRRVVIQPVSEPTKIPGLPFSGRNSSPRDRTLSALTEEHWEMMMQMVEKYHAFFHDGELLTPAHMTPAGKVVPLEEGPSGWDAAT